MRRASQLLVQDQVAAKQELLQAAAEADDMFELLLQHKDKLSPADQARLCCSRAAALAATASIAAALDDCTVKSAVKHCMRSSEAAHRWCQSVLTCVQG